MRRISVVLAFAVMFILAADVLASRGRASRAGEEIEGVITALTREQVTIRTRQEDRAVRLTAETKVNTVLQVGDAVEARVRKETDGTFTAISIEVEGEREITGVVKSVSATSLTITVGTTDVTFTLTPETVVLLNRLRVTPDALVPGMKVEVESLRSTSGPAVAAVVRAKSEFVEVEGSVTAISATSITVRRRDGSDVTVGITPETVIRVDRRKATPAVIAIGAIVEVKALRKADGSLVAVLIELEDQNELVEIKGSIAAIDGNSLTVRTRSGDDVKIELSADTIVRRAGRRIAATDLRVGDRVEVKAAPGTPLKAVHINVEREEDDAFVEYNGSIKSITGSVLTLATRNGSDVTFSITSTTVFRNTKVSDLKVGDVVEVVARRNSDGSLEALLVELENNNDDDDDRELEFEGMIASFSPTSLKLTTRGGDVTFTINAQTVVKDGPLKVGARAEVKATRNADGSYTATKIEIED